MSSEPRAPVHDRLAENLAGIRERIAAACLRSGRDPNDVTLIAVTKYTPLDRVRELVGLGHLTLGESRPQQLLERAGLLPSGVEWHLIGHLQRNKVRSILPVMALIHSIDSLRLLKRIDQVAGELGLRPRVLLQVNVSGERTKDGFPMAELETRWSEVLGYRHVEVRGLMTMAPLTEDDTLIRPVFRGLRELRDRLNVMSPEPCLRELSMGMSGDFDIAIEEGATLVRLGSLLFDGCETK